MLSRVALSRGAQAQQVLVRGLSVSAPNMERDLVNFPPRVRPVEKAPVRCLVFPEEWFTACYSKTGVTGPYMFLVGVGTFLASKEFFVMEHDFYVGLGLAAVLTLVVKQVILSLNLMLKKSHLFDIRSALTGLLRSTRTLTKRRPSSKPSDRAKLTRSRTVSRWRRSPSWTPPPTLTSSLQRRRL